MYEFLYYLSLVAMSTAYIYAGVMHFRAYRFFESIVPPILPFKAAIVYVSGIIEICLGLALLVPQSRVIAAWGVIALLIIVYPANIYMLVARLQGKKFKRISVSFLWLRLALQFLLVFWAYSFTY